MTGTSESEGLSDWMSDIKDLDLQSARVCIVAKSASNTLIRCQIFVLTRRGIVRILLEIEPALHNR